MKPQSLRKLVCIAALFTAAPSFAAVVGSNQAVDFNDTSTSFSFLGSTFTLTDNNDFFSPVSVSTQGSAAVASTTLFGLQPSSFFDPERSPLTFDSSYQYSGYTNPTVIPFSGPPTFIGLRASVGSDFYYGYAQFAGTFLKAYGFETTPNLGIRAGAALTEVSAVPVPAAWALMLSAFSFFGVALRNRRKSSLMNNLKLA